MAGKSEPSQKLNVAYGAVLFVGGFSIIIGLVALLFEVRLLQQYGHGYASILSGIVFVILSVFVRRGSMTALAIAVGFYVLDGIVFLSAVMKGPEVPPVGGILFRILLLIPMIRGFGAIQEMRQASGPIATPRPSSVPSSPSFTRVSVPAPPPLAQGSIPASISFVAPSAEAIPKQAPLDPHAGTVRFVAYRCEIDKTGIRAVYTNSNRRELAWADIGGIVARMFPLGPPLEGKLLLDVIPVNRSGNAVRPIRLLSDTYVNYAALPQGQAASSRENIRRLGEWMLTQNAAIYLDPGTTSFLRSGMAPVRFTHMSQFTEYDSRYA